MTTLEHLRPWPDLDRITAAQAAERMACGIFCWKCRAGNKKLKPVPGLKDRLGCTQCLRERKKDKQATSRNARQIRVFGITAEEGDLIIEFQGGGCICADWTGYNGKTRALSTDHDHKTGVVRGKLCKQCNDLLGRVRDDPAYFRRMIAYLENPPAVRLFGERVVPGHVAPDAPCSGEIHSWRYFTPEQMDSYYIRCTELGPHDEHRDAHTGAHWK